VSQESDGQPPVVIYWSSTAFGHVVSGMPLPLGVPPNFFLKQDAKYEYDMTTGTGVSMATLHTLREIRAKSSSTKIPKQFLATASTCLNFSFSSVFQMAAEI
jgi:hypothetical protein